MPSQEDIKHQQELLEINRRNLDHYIKQQDLLGKAYAPPIVAHGIQEARTNIKRIKGILRGWGISVKNKVNDEEQADSATLSAGTPSQTTNSSSTISAQPTGASSTSPATRPLRAFLCHSSGDKPAVRDLYRRLRAEGVAPWLDEEELLPGQVWDLEIRRAIRKSDVVLVCLSRASISKAGYLQKELRRVLDVADEQPEGTIFVIPIKLEECEVPDRLSAWHWVDLFEENGFERLMLSLRARANEIGATISPAV